MYKAVKVKCLTCRKMLIVITNSGLCQNKVLSLSSSLLLSLLVHLLCYYIIIIIIIIIIILSLLLLLLLLHWRKMFSIFLLKQVNSF